LISIFDFSSICMWNTVLCIVICGNHTRLVTCKSSCKLRYVCFDTCFISWGKTTIMLYNVLDISICLILKYSYWIDSDWIKDVLFAIKVYNRTIKVNSDWESHRVRSKLYQICDSCFLSLWYQLNFELWMKTWYSNIRYLIRRSVCKTDVSVYK